MKIGLVSYEFKNNDIEFNISQIKKAVEKSSNEVDLLCFGETFLQGFDALSWEYEKDSTIAISQSSQVMKRLREISKNNDVDLLIPYIEKCDLDIYSSCALIVNGSVEYNYRRISTGWKVVEKATSFYKEGIEVEGFYYKNKKFMVGLCGDLWLYPEKFKSDVLIWPVYVNFSVEEWEVEKKEYAEQAYKVADRVLMVNSISNNPDSVGGAFVFQNKTIIDELEFNKEEILTVDI